MRISWWYHPRLAPLRRVVESELFAIIFLALCFMVSLTSDFTIGNMQVFCGVQEARIVVSMRAISFTHRVVEIPHRGDIAARRFTATKFKEGLPTFACPEWGFEITVDAVDRTHAEAALGLGWLGGAILYTSVGVAAKVLTKSIQEDNPNYRIDGNVSFGLLYMVYGIFLWLVPSLIALIRPKFGLLLGAVCVLGLVFSYSLEATWATYVGVVLGGIGASLVWVSQGSFMIMTSTPANLNRNVGILWIFVAFSMILGNLYAASELDKKDRLDWATRHLLIYKLCGIAIAGIVLLVFLPQPYLGKDKGSGDRPAKKDPQDEDRRSEASARPGLTATEALKKMWQILCTVEMQFLLVTFIYVGFQHSFGQGIYSSAVGFTKRFGKLSKELVPVCGLVYGLGELVGGIMYAGAAKLLSGRPGGRHLASATMIIAITLHVISYITMFINIPDAAAFGDTGEHSILTRPRWHDEVSNLVPEDEADHASKRRHTGAPPQTLVGDVNVHSTRHGVITEGGVQTLKQAGDNGKRHAQSIIVSGAVGVISQPSRNFEAWLALLGSLMMGMGDCSLNTQIMPLLAKLQPEYSPQTCALYKFTQSIAMACYFFLSTCMSFHVQLIVNTCLGLLGVFAFVIINRRMNQQEETL
ncbi:hypothetical protein AAG570_001110 [Ranatra chinensis]|uniref:UNC93-like protein MFSD11 n=1 Tax=Ranatra chinensis TaxID=642074 RepID=A0ABD0YZ32_9HEMI